VVGRRRRAAPDLNPDIVPMITVLETTLASAAAADGARVPLLVHRPARPDGCLVWAHGGSWQHGSAAAWAPVTAALASRSGWMVTSVDYRLAPRHRFPAAVLDVLAALDWADAHAADLPVVVGGDSAGGTIAALAALARRDAGRRVPPQLLAYPPLDPACASGSYRSAPRSFPGKDELRAAWRLWLGTRAVPLPRHPTRIHPTPLRAPSLAGLAPVFLVVGEDDPVRDDANAYTDRLHADAVPTSLRVLPGVGHADLLTTGGRVLPELAAALREHTTSPPAPEHDPAKGRLP